MISIQSILSKAKQLHPLEQIEITQLMATHDLEEEYLQFLERMGKDLIRQKLEPLTQVLPFDQERDLYYDWGADEPSKIKAGGSGEYAGVVG